MLIILQQKLKKKYFTLQINFKQNCICLLKLPKEKGNGRKVEKQMSTKGRQTKHRGNHCAMNTDTVMHEDITPCLHHSFERFILHMDIIVQCLCGSRSWQTALAAAFSIEEEEKLNINVQIPTVPCFPAS
ncbi:hypothetical protein XENOCAPTIV_022618 [Xenoophorus captivus]|uniref:Uncharacterized protein n=1 Tax=Xenoophorus captivus TaxID=1517983 RepID=A0ABV0QE59_9TELE